MRAYAVLCAVLLAAMLLCPLAALGAENHQVINTGAIQTLQAEKEEYISVMSSSTGETERIKLREYVVGALAAEMSPLYHTQALKAQAVACYTYAKRQREKNENSISSYFARADITDDPATHQGYISEKQRKERWGENFEEYEAKIEAVVDEVYGVYLAFDGETALAAYHAVSAGNTQSAKSMWGSEYPYLSSVSSPGDKLSPDYIYEKSFAPEEFKKLAKECGVALSGDAEDWLKAVEKNNDGYTAFVRLGATDIEAEDIRNAFSLRSMCFDIEFDGEKFVFSGKGYGHGVGMSQYGADYMARQGFSWQEILEHYYSGAEIVNN